MNPTLLRAVRERMQAQTTEQLLELWVTNDRAMWAPETFEVVRQILAERGHAELPRQNDPAPLAQKRTFSNDPVVDYWMGWLRPVLYIAIAAGAVRLANDSIFLLDGFDANTLRDARPEILALFASYVIGDGLMVLLIVGSVACIRVLPWGRMALVVYAWAHLSALAAGLLFSLRTFIYLDARQVFRGFATTASSAVLPAVLLVLLRRPEIKAIFSRQGGTGFEPALSRRGGADPPRADGDGHAVP